uniref:Uncharacterized protein n=1 Tax=Arundo donax TaxID=35708 RepID=A0A0A9DDE9_ARUDO
MDHLSDAIDRVGEGSATGCLPFLGGRGGRRFAAATEERPNRSLSATGSSEFGAARWVRGEASESA